MSVRIIAGPCQHESLDQSIRIAEYCSEVCKTYGFDYIFKASYDKANRTHISSERGLGMKQTLKDFFKIKDRVNCQTLTDVHDKEQVRDIMREFSDCVDILQIPAFLCRQTDLVVEACNTGKIVNIKKGQFLAPWDIKGVLSKCSGEVWITERGTSFGYNTLVVDFTGIQYMLNNFDNVVFDVTHSVQKPGGQGDSTGGNREYISGLSRAAAAMGVKNFFIETHEDPDVAPSDGPNMVKLDKFEELIDGIHRHTNPS
jgi:2-dehydro-3-deoxyphosphooctonate aldolase (KDO 8-P synthase)